MNLGLSWLLKDVLGAPGLVLASTAAIVLQTLLMQHCLARALPGMGLGDLWRTIGQVLLATLAMGLLVAAGARLLPGAGLSLRQADVLAVGGLIPLGAAVYAAGLWLLRVEGREEFTRAFQRWRAGRK